MLFFPPEKGQSKIKMHLMYQGYIMKNNYNKNGPKFFSCGFMLSQEGQGASGTL